MTPAGVPRDAAARPSFCDEGGNSPGGGGGVPDTIGVKSTVSSSPSSSAGPKPSVDGTPLPRWSSALLDSPPIHS